MYYASIYLISKISFHLCALLLYICTASVVFGQIPLPIKQSVREINNLQNEAKKRSGSRNIFFDAKMSDLSPKNLNHNMIFIDFVETFKKKQSNDERQNVSPKTVIRLYFPIINDINDIKKSWINYLYKKYKIVPEKKQDSLLVFQNIKIKKNDSESLNLCTYISSNGNYSHINAFLRGVNLLTIPLEKSPKAEIISQLLFDFGHEYFINRLSSAQKKEEQKQTSLKHTLTLKSKQSLNLKESLRSKKMQAKNEYIQMHSIKKRREIMYDSILTLNKSYAKLSTHNTYEINIQRKKLYLLRKEFGTLIKNQKQTKKSYADLKTDIRTLEQDYDVTSTLIKRLKKEIQTIQVKLNFFSQQINILNQNNHL